MKTQTSAKVILTILSDTEHSYRTLVLVPIIIFLLVLNYFLVTSQYKKRHMRGVFTGTLLNMLRESATPFAVFSRNDLRVCYTNKTFAKIWRMEHMNFTANELFNTADGAPLIKALKQVGDHTPELRIGHQMDKVFNHLFFESVFQLAGDGRYILQTMHDVTAVTSYNESLKMDLAIKKSQIALMNEELLRTGRELEESFIDLENAGSRILNILEQLPLPVDFTGVGYWSLDLQKMSIRLSKEAQRVFGIQHETEIPINDIKRLIDRQHDVEIDELIKERFQLSGPKHYDFKINPADGQLSRWLKISGTVLREADGKPVSLKGIIIVNDFSVNDK